MENFNFDDSGNSTPKSSRKSEQGRQDLNLLDIFSTVFEPDNKPSTAQSKSGKDVNDVFNLSYQGKPKLSLQDYLKIAQEQAQQKAQQKAQEESLLRKRRANQLDSQEFYVNSDSEDIDLNTNEMQERFSKVSRHDFLDYSDFLFLTDVNGLNLLNLEWLDPSSGRLRDSGGLEAHSAGLSIDQLSRGYYLGFDNNSARYDVVHVDGNHFVALAIQRGTDNVLHARFYNSLSNEHGQDSNANDVKDAVLKGIFGSDLTLDFKIIKGTRQGQTAEDINNCGIYAVLGLRQMALNRDVDYISVNAEEVLTYRDAVDLQALHIQAENEKQESADKKSEAAEIDNKSLLSPSLDSRSTGKGPDLNNNL